MNRLAGIIVAVIGLLLTALSIAKVTAGLTTTGIALILLGLLMIGLSFVPKPAADDTSKMSTPATLLNMFFAPTEVFQNLRRHPRWLAAILIMSILSAIFLNLFMYRLTSDRVANYAIDKTLEISFIANNEEAKKGVEAGRPKALEDNKNPVLRAGQAVNGFVGQVFLYAFLGAIFFVFALAMGGQLNYWQAFAAAVYAAFPIAVIKFVLNTIVLFIKDPTEIHPILGQSSLIQDSLNFLVNPADNPVIFVFLGSFSLFTFYWIWLNATGLKNTGEKVSSSASWTITISLFVVMMLFGMIATYIFPSFIS
jgi:hypothetical protein